MSLIPTDAVQWKFTGLNKWWKLNLSGAHALGRWTIFSLCPDVISITSTTSETQGRFFTLLSPRLNNRFWCWNPFLWSLGHCSVVLLCADVLQEAMLWHWSPHWTFCGEYWSNTSATPLHLFEELLTVGWIWLLLHYHKSLILKTVLASGSTSERHEHIWMNLI